MILYTLDNVVRGKKNSNQLTNFVNWSLHGNSFINKNLQNLLRKNQTISRVKLGKIKLSTQINFLSRYLGVPIDQYNQKHPFMLYKTCNTICKHTVKCANYGFVYQKSGVNAYLAINTCSGQNVCRINRWMKNQTNVWTKINCKATHGSYMDIDNPDTKLLLHKLIINMGMKELSFNTLCQASMFVRKFPHSNIIGYIDKIIIEDPIKDVMLRNLLLLIEIYPKKEFLSKLSDIVVINDSFSIVQAICTPLLGVNILVYECQILDEKTFEILVSNGLHTRTTIIFCNIVSFTINTHKYHDMRNVEIYCRSAIKITNNSRQSLNIKILGVPYIEIEISKKKHARTKIFFDLSKFLCNDTLLEKQKNRINVDKFQKVIINAMNEIQLTNMDEEELYGLTHLSNLYGKNEKMRIHNKKNLRQSNKII